MISARCYSQDTLAQKNHLSDSVIEHYFVLKSAPEKRVGLYTVFLRRKVLLVRGKYNDGKKSGVWQFYDVQGRLSEKYNYDKKAFTYEAPVYESGDYSYLFDDSLKRGDRLTRALKIGGSYFGFVPFLNIFKVPFDTFDVDTNEFTAYIELLISPMGQLADYKIRLISDYYQYDRIFNMYTGLLSPDDRVFMPATKNGEPVISRIMIKCFVTGNGGLDFY